MSTAQERRRAKAAQKQKKSRAKAQKARANQQRSATPSATKAARWPLGDCLISENWYDWGATVHAVLVRQHTDGTAAALFVEVDLANKGLVLAEAIVPIHPATLQQKIAERSEARALIFTEPAHIAQLVHEAVAFNQRHGHPLPAGLGEVEGLLGSLDPDDSPHELRFGEEGEDDDTEEVPRMSLLDRVRGWFALE